MNLKSHKGFTLVELLMVIGIGALMLTVLLPSFTSAREVDNRIKCARNLRQIGQAMLLYATDNKGMFPRARFVRDGTVITSNQGFKASDPFPDGVGANNIGASLFLLLRTQDISAEVFICPSTENEKDTFGGGTNTALNRANFADLSKNLSYSIQNMFPDTTAVSSGFKWNSSVTPGLAIMADKNPGATPERDNVFAPASEKDPAEKQKLANSNNHNKEGQNVLFGDGKVEFVTNPWAGVAKDNIYTRSGTTKFGTNFSPADANDSILLPTDGEDGKS